MSRKEELELKVKQALLQGYFKGFKDGYQQCSCDEETGDWTDDDEALNFYAQAKTYEYGDSLKGDQV